MSRARIPFLNRLGVRVSLLLVAFVLLLGLAAGLLIAGAFEETQRGAAERSARGLEEQAERALLEITRREALLNDMHLQHAAAQSRTLAEVMSARLEAQPASSSQGTPSLTQTEAGAWYEPAPTRVSDLWVPRQVAPEAALPDLRDAAVLDALFPVLMAQDTDAVALYFVNPRGAVRYYPPSELHTTLPADLDVTVQPVYTLSEPGANPQRSTRWTPPYLDDAGHGLLVTVSTPVYVNGRFRGVANADVSLERLAAELERLEPVPRSYGFLVDGEGNLIAASGRALEALLDYHSLPGDLPPFGASLATLASPEFQEALGAMRAGASGQRRMSLGGEEVLVTYAALPSLGWSLAVAAPLHEITVPARSLAAAVRRDSADTLSRALLLMSGFFLLALLSAATFSRSLLTRPIAALVSSTERLARGDLGARLNVSARDELGLLANSFNTMATNLQSNQQALEARGRELSASNAALRESEARFRMLADNAPVMVWMSGEDEYGDYFNQTWLAFRGRKLEDEQGEGWREGVHPDDLAACLRTYQTAFARCEPFEAEYRLRRADGEYRWVLDRGVPRCLPDGSLMGFIGSCIDVTERVEARRLLEQRVAERTRELAMVLEVSHNVASTLELRPLLSLILSELGKVVAHTASSVLVLSPDGRELVQLEYQGPAPRDHALSLRFPLEALGILWESVARGEALIIDDVWGETPQARAYRRMAGEAIMRRPDAGGLRSWLLVPLMVKEQIIGAVAVQHREPGRFTEASARLVAAIAAQASVAVENARLFEQAQASAALQERQKLARELHDSVSQALYGIALGAKTAKAQLLRDPERAKEPLDYVMGLAEAGLAEMRALIFELRPESLEEEGLVTALSKHAASLRARYGLEVSVRLDAEPALPLKAKEALYRIAQEALHNIVKHAQASRVELELELLEDRLVLRIADDGLGFDATDRFPGHLGLKSMRERAAAFGGSVHLKSAPGAGTHLTASLPLAVLAS